MNSMEKKFLTNVCEGTVRDYVLSNLILQLLLLT